MYGKMENRERMEGLGLKRSFRRRLPVKDNSPRPRLRGDSCNLVRSGWKPGDAAPGWIKHPASFSGGSGCATTHGIRRIPHCQKTSRLSV